MTPSEVSLAQLLKAIAQRFRAQVQDDSRRRDNPLECFLMLLKVMVEAVRETLLATAGCVLREVELRAAENSLGIEVYLTSTDAAGKHHQVKFLWDLVPEHLQYAFLILAVTLGTDTLVSESEVTIRIVAPRLQTLTNPEDTDHADAFLDFARRGCETEFKELARMTLHLGEAEIADMWRGTCARLS